MDFIMFEAVDYNARDGLELLRTRSMDWNGCNC